MGSVGGLDMVIHLRGNGSEGLGYLVGYINTNELVYDIIGLGPCAFSDMTWHLPYKKTNY